MNVMRGKCETVLEEIGRNMRIVFVDLVSGEQTACYDALMLQFLTPCRLSSLARFLLFPMRNRPEANATTFHRPAKFIVPNFSETRKIDREFRLLPTPSSSPFAFPGYLVTASCIRR